MAARNEAELGQRVATLRRFRELLLQQRAKFQNYMQVLDYERADIDSGDVDKLTAHVEIEEAIVSEIFTFQRVIDPLERMYRSAYPAAAAEEAGLPELRSSLDDLRNEVLRRNAENRALLRRRMDTVRAEISGFRNPLAARASVYARQGEGSLVDMKG